MPMSTSVGGGQEARFSGGDDAFFGGQLCAGCALAWRGGWVAVRGGRSLEGDRLRGRRAGEGRLCRSGGVVQSAEPCVDRAKFSKVTLLAGGQLQPLGVTSGDHAVPKRCLDGQKFVLQPSAAGIHGQPTVPVHARQFGRRHSTEGDGYRADNGLAHCTGRLGVGWGRRAARRRNGPQNGSCRSGDTQGCCVTRPSRTARWISAP